MGFHVMCPVLGMDMLGSWGTKGKEQKKLEQKEARSGILIHRGSGG